jgi:hypothetical protein
MRRFARFRVNLCVFTTPLYYFSIEDVEVDAAPSPCRALGEPPGEGFSFTLPLTMPRVGESSDG